MITTRRPMPSASFVLPKRPEATENTIQHAPRFGESSPNTGQPTPKQSGKALASKLLIMAGVLSGGWGAVQGLNFYNVVSDPAPMRTYVQGFEEIEELYKGIGNSPTADQKAKALTESLKATVQTILEYDLQHHPDKALIRSPKAFVSNMFGNLSATEQDTLRKNADKVYRTLDQTPRHQRFLEMLRFNDELLKNNADYSKTLAALARFTTDLAKDNQVYNAFPGSVAWPIGLGGLMALSGTVMLKMAGRQQGSDKTT
jgi:hypothetical protein